MKKARLLMCRPDYYGIKYEINPWMKLERQADLPLAQLQWQELYRVVTKEMGTEVELIPQASSQPDMVFTANAGFLWQDIFFLSRFRYPQRQGETPLYRAWFEARGYQVIQLRDGCRFEGEGDIFTMGDSLFAGYRFRSDLRSHLFIGEFLGRKVFSLELADPRFYHLDTCFCPLSPDAALYYPAAFTPESVKVIKDNILESIPVSEADVLNFGCNALVVDNKVVLNKGCDSLAGTLRELRFQVCEVDLSEFIKAGGAAKCLVLFLEGAPGLAP